MGFDGSGDFLGFSGRGFSYKADLIPSWTKLRQMRAKPRRALSRFAHGRTANGHGLRDLLLCFGFVLIFVGEKQDAGAVLHSCGRVAFAGQIKQMLTGFR